MLRPRRTRSSRGCARLANDRRDRLSYLRAALDVALSRIEAPAFVITSHGTIRETNAAARALFALSPKPLTSALRAAAGGRRPTVPVELVPITDEGCWLAIVRPTSADARVAACIASCHARWTLTKRQTQVLTLVAQGLSNAAIAAELRCGERTVELHMTALFDRAGVDSRAALVVKVPTMLS